MSPALRYFRAVAYVTLGSAAIAGGVVGAAMVGLAAAALVITEGW